MVVSKTHKTMGITVYDEYTMDFQEYGEISNARRNIGSSAWIIQHEINSGEMDKKVLTEAIDEIYKSLERLRKMQSNLVEIVQEPLY